MASLKSLYDFYLLEEFDVIEEFSSLDTTKDPVTQKDRILLRDLHRVLMILDKSARSAITSNYTIYSILALLAVHESKRNDYLHQHSGQEESQQSLSQSTISHLINIRPQSLGPILSQMEKDGYIQRTPSKKDKRALHVELTQLGTDYLSALKHGHDSFAQAIFEDFSNEEKESLQKGLNKLMSALMLY